MIQRWRLNASRNMGLSTTLSALALKVADNCFSALFHQLGTSPPAHFWPTVSATAADAMQLPGVRRGPDAEMPNRQLGSCGPLGPPRPDQVEISVFGPSYGECIVAHLGHGNWIVVD